jgi:MscS family membrane protein
VLKLAESMKVRFAFPTQTLHMETFPGQPSLTPESLEDMDALKEQLATYFKSQEKNKTLL